MKNKKKTMVAMMVCAFVLVMVGCADNLEQFGNGLPNWLMENPYDLGRYGADTAEAGDFAPYLYDLDGNGTMDAVVGDSDGYVYFIFNSSLTDFEASEYRILRTAKGSTKFSSNAAPAVHDFNGDGKWELIVGTGTGEVFLVTFTDYNAINMHYEVTPIMADGVAMVTPSGYAVPDITDLNGDGFADLIVGTEDGNIYYYESTGALDQAPVTKGKKGRDATSSAASGAFLFTYKGVAPVNVGSRAAPAIIQLDKSDSPAVVVGNADGEIYACASLYGPCELEGQFGSNAKPAAGDVNNDGMVDLVIGTGGGELWYVPALNM